jgi:hypothetical protein
MLAFEITVDGEAHPTAGMENWSVLSVIISAVRRGDSEHGEIDLSPGGLTAVNAEGVAHHFCWKRTHLSVGSTINVRVVDIDSLPPPERVYRSDHSVQESAFTEEEIEEFEREEWLRLKAKFDP